uniref:Uncharacterized protein n=1 Tax=Anopheles minimus TaxID=112268 RepID=A0A182WPS4_9DIPT
MRMYACASVRLTSNKKKVHRKIAAASSLKTQQGERALPSSLDEDECGEGGK